MKKLMVSTIILLPILLLAILLVSGAIMSMVTHIYVESVEFVKNEALILTMSDEDAPPTYDVTDEITILPLRAKNRDLKFGTDDESIVTVDENGIVKASYYGETYISVVSKENKAAVAKRKVIVTDDNVHSISINDKETLDHSDLYQGDYGENSLDKLKLSFSVIPKEAKIKNVTWTSSDERILKIDGDDGTIEEVCGAGVGEVTVTVTVTSNDGSEKQDFITFNCHKQLTGLSFDSTDIVSSLTEFDFPTVKPIPAEVAGDVKITYSSSDPGIATVDQSGHITFSGAGKVTITATATDFKGGEKGTQTANKIYTSTAGYYGEPLFQDKVYKVNYEDYADGKTPLPIQFAPTPVGTYRKFIDASFEYDGVLRVDASNESDVKFYFDGEMPARTKSIRVEVNAYVYRWDSGKVEQFNDSFTLTVLRDATSAAVSYGETEDVGSIVLSTDTLQFDTSAATSGLRNAHVSALPANQTNDIRYFLAEGDEETATIDQDRGQGELKFLRPGKVTVTVCFMNEDGHATIEKQIAVIYAPLVEQEGRTPKGIEIVESAEGEVAPDQPPIVLNMGTAGQKSEEGILYFSEPAGATVSYEVVSEAGTVPEELPVKIVMGNDGAQHIVPQRGGFATVRITVTPGGAAPVLRRDTASENNVKVYTVDIYVDRPVETEDLQIALDGSVVNGSFFGTASEEVFHSFTVDEKDGSMQGKKLYVKYTKNGDEVKVYGEDNIAGFTGNIPFAETLSSITVTFGVEYTENARALNVNVKDLTSVTRKVTIERNASEIKVAHGGAQETEKLVTNSRTLRFGSDISVTVLPANHTDTGIAYSVTGEGAELRDSTLTFTETASAHTVTVRISVKRGDAVTLGKEISVTYLPKTNSDIDLGSATEEESYLLFARNEKANVYLSVPTGVTVETEKSGDAVKLVEISDGAYMLTAENGGFATVTVKVGEKTFAVHAYVDVPVAAGDFEVDIENADTFGTTLTSVPFNVTVASPDGRMEGKRIVVLYGEERPTGTDGGTSLEGYIKFPEMLGERKVTFTVEYTEGANAFGASNLQPAVSRTLQRNASGIKLAYGGASETEHIVTTSSTLTFGTDVEVTVLPESHTDTAVSYAAENGGEVAQMNNAILRFRKAGTVNVKISVKRGDAVTLEKEISVTYLEGTNKDIDLGTATKDVFDLLFAKDEKANVYLSVPTGVTVEAEKSGDAVKLDEISDGAYMLTAENGGFATVTVKVGESKSYTVNAYVDVPVAESDLKVNVGEADTKGTTDTSIPFAVTVANTNGQMEGKRIVVTYGEERLTGTDDGTMFEGKVKFPETLGELRVTFTVEYTEEANAFGASNLQPAVSRTLQRNASEIKVAYGGASETEHIVTTSSTLTFGTDIEVTVLPESHTDKTIVYSVEEEGAKVEQNKLTFQKAGIFSVTISVKRGDAVTLEKEISVVHLTGTNKDIDLGTSAKKEFNIVFAKGEKANIYLSVPKDTAVNAENTDRDVVTLENAVEGTDGAYVLTANKGGFATITVTAGDTKYTVHAYVDVPLSADDFTIKFGEKDPYYNGAGYTFGTAGDDVPYNFTVNEKDGSMQGKKLYVTYETVKQEGEADAASLNGSIDFKDQATLVVTFSVKYSDDALEYGAKAETLRVSRSVTLKRDATGANFIYKGEEVASISTIQTTLTFITGDVESTNASQVGVIVAPANHTNTLSYSLGEETDMASITSTGVLTFKTTEDMTEATKVTVKLSLLGDDGNAVVTETIDVTYQPHVKQQVNIELSADNSVQKVLLNFGDTGNIIYSKPTDATVSYEVTEGVSVVEVTEQESAMPKIVTKQGGFATVTVTVTPTGGGENTVFTIQLYVDRTVKTENYKVQFNGTECTGTFGTTSTTDVPFTVTFDGNGNEGAMEGKKFYISYSLNGEPKHVSAEKAGSSFTGTIPFAKDLSALSVTFGVEYDAEATADFDPKQDSGTAIRTIERNVSAITVAYGGATDTVALITRATSLTFGDRAANVTYTLAPENHTENGIQYAVEGNGASFTGNTLTFEGDTLCTVKVLIKTMRGNEVTFTKTITVTHLPATDKDIDFGTAESLTQNIVLAPNGTARIYFTVQNGDEIGEEVTLGDNSVVMVEKVSEEIEGAYTVTAQKGGFATVTVTAGEKTYTLNVYVDAAVNANDLEVAFGENVDASLGTTEESVPFTVTVDNTDGKMEGKKIVVTYGNAALSDTQETKEGNTYTLKGTIPFSKDLGSLKVTFKVEYTVDTIETYGVDNNDLKEAAVNKTLQRNAESITFTHDGVANAAKIVTSATTLTFGKDVTFTVQPESHTDTTIEYSVTEGTGAHFEANTLIFTEGTATTVTVTVAMKRGETVTLSETIVVSYVPANGAEEINVNTATSKNLVFKLGESKQVIFYYTLAKDETATCTATGENVVELSNDNGAWHVTPAEGGFSAVTFKVGEVTKYTLNVYVDLPVAEKDLKVDFGEADTKGTTLTSVPFTVTVDNKDGKMNGKHLILAVGTLSEGVTETWGEETYTFTGEIPFAVTLGTLDVTFMVGYTEAAKEYVKDGTKTFADVTRTLERNAESITVKYGDIETVKFSTGKNEFVIGEDIIVDIQPVHTDTVSYSLEGAEGIATLEGGTITFQKAGTVTLRIQMMRGETSTYAQKSVTISYEPTNEGEKAVDLTGDTSIVLKPAQKAHIYFVEPAGAEATYALTGDGVVTADQTTGVYTVTAKKGGFATVTVTAGSKKYTVSIYVDAAVDRNNLSISFVDGVDAFGTKESTVTFTITYDGEDAMQGKVLYYQIGSGKKQYGKADSATFNVTIENIFSESELSLIIDYGIEHSDTAKGYDGIESESDIFKQATVYRNAESISFGYNDMDVDTIVTTKEVVSFGTSSSGDDIENVEIAYSPITPAGTTTRTFSIVGENNGVAEIDAGTGKLTFYKTGAVQVKVEVERGGKTFLEATLTVVYLEEQDDSRTFEFGKDSVAAITYLVLKPDEITNVFGTFEKGVHEFSAGPDGGDILTLTQVGDACAFTFTAKKGGFAAVTVTADGKTYTFNVYVDVPVTEEDIEIKFNDIVCSEGSFRTSKTSVTYAVTVTDKNGSMAGKQISVSYGEETTVITNGGSGTITITDFINSHSIIFTVVYDEEQTAEYSLSGTSVISVSKTLSSSKEQLDKPVTVTYDDKNGDKIALKEGEENKLTIAYINKDNCSITLTIDENSFVPQDFVPDALKVKNTALTANENVGVTFSFSENCKQIILKGLSGTKGVEMELTIGGRQFKLTVTVTVPVNKITLNCGGTGLETGTNYVTLLGSLTFNILVERDDDMSPTSRNVKYSFDKENWTMVEINSDVNTATFTVSGFDTTGSNTLYICSEDGSIEWEFHIQYQTLTSFRLEFTVNKNKGGPVTFGEATIDDPTSLSYAIPSDAQNVVTIKVTPIVEGTVIAGLGSLSELFPTVTKSDENWVVGYGTGSITITTQGVAFSEAVTFTSNGGTVVSITLSRLELMGVEFTGFDSKNNANGGDVYKGYQQVRVFAKHSDYGAGQVDYFRMPVTAWSDSDRTQVALKLLTWTFTGYRVDTATDFKLTQSGTQVVYGGETYTIVKNPIEGKPSTLKLVKDDGTETIIAEGGKYTTGTKVPWVDVYAEAGYAHLYFGGFTGLSETDVQNDYFGNFDDREKWKQVTEADVKDNSGRNFTPSGGAYTFLRVEAGDGAVGGINCHFNFNILADDDLVNVFNAAGYYAHSKIVLHENLYGPSEDGRTDDALTLTNVSLDKNTIYGNGYQVNFEAKNTAMGKYSESDGIAVNNAYNTVIKCANPNEEISSTYQRMVLKMAYAYYCDLSYYYKFNPAGNTFYTKNTVFSCVPKTAVQLYYNDNALYAENIVMVEVGTAIQADNKDGQNVKIYLKGSIDILNYMNKPALNNMNPLVGSMYAEVAKSLANYLEWHGKKVEGLVSTNSEATKQLYANVLAFAYSDLSGKTYTWTDSGYKTLSEGGGGLNSGAKITNKNLMSSYYALTYEMMNEAGNARLDGAQASVNWALKFTGSTDLSKLFSEDRYIRLQCQFKDKEVKNEDHILWHKQEVYRDKTLISGREGHIDNLKNSLKGVRWSDGSGVDSGGAVISTMTRLLSETVLPGKED